MAERIVITVDGLAGSGKSTIARDLAKHLGMIHFSSGLLYRAVGYLGLIEKLDLTDGSAMANLLERHKLTFVEGANGTSQLRIDGVSPEGKIFAPEVSEAASIIAVHSEVRKALLPVQRDAFAGRGLVAEGRDMGSVVFPGATLKIFIEASEPVRIERRLRQMEGAAGKLNEEKRSALHRAATIEISERDRRDSERALSPAKAAKDALVIDNSKRPLAEVLAEIYGVLKSRGLGPKIGH